MKYSIDLIRDSSTTDVVSTNAQPGRYRICEEGQSSLDLAATQEMLGMRGDQVLLCLR